MIIEKIEDPEENVWLENKKTKTKYTRIIGALAWPSINPGFALVVAEDFSEDPSLKIRHIRSLAEAENEDLETLFQKCLEFRERYCVQDFYGNRENEPMMKILYDYNQGLKDIPSLSLCLASFPEDLGYHLYRIKGYLKEDKKILHFGEESILPNYLLELSPEEAVRGSVYDYPAIAALGYAISYLRGHPWKRKKSSRGWRYQRPTSWKTV